VAAASGSSTAVVFYQGILILVWGIEWLLKTFLLPAVDLYLLLGLTNQLSEEALLGRMAGLLNTVISWALRTILGTMVGLQVIQSLIAPAIDGLKRSAVGKTAQALPGIGNAIGSVTQLLLGSAVLVRNSLGVVFLIVLVFIGLQPLLQYALLSLAYRFLAALTQPVCDKRLVGCLGTMGEGCALLLRLCLTAEVMCVLSFLVLMVPAQGG
jgi:stage III sporulation protein AE